MAKLSASTVYLRRLRPGMSYLRKRMMTSKSSYEYDSKFCVQVSNAYPANIYQSYRSPIYPSYPVTRHPNQLEVAARNVPQPIYRAPVSVPVSTTMTSVPQQPARVQYITAVTAPPEPKVRERSTESNMLDDVNRFLNQTNTRPFVSDIETLGGNFQRTSARAPVRSDLETAMGKALRGNIFETKFII